MKPTPRRVSSVAPVILVILLWSVIPAAAQTEVKVVGVPDVSVPKPIPHSELVVFRDIAVSSTRGNGTGKIPLPAPSLPTATQASC